MFRVYLLAALLFSAGSFAEVISVNFYNGADFGAVKPDVFLGVVEDPSWDNCQYSIPVEVPSFYDVDGSTMDVVFGKNMANVAGLSSWNHKANRHGLGISTSKKTGMTRTVTLNEIPVEKYYVIVYLGGYNAKGKPSAGSVSVGDKTLYFNFSLAKGQLIQSSDTDSGDGCDAGSYVIFGSAEAPLTGGSQTLILEKMEESAVGIGGIQVVGVQ